MSDRVLRVRNPVAALEEGVRAIQQEQQLAPSFPDEVTEAARAAAQNPRLPDLDRTDLDFITLDPSGSMDLDQALHLDRTADGYLVHYAIADVATFVEAGGVIDREARRRGESLYGADATIPLHPRELSEGAASLLPGQIRPAFLWTLTLDAAGALSDARVERAQVRSVARFDYQEAQELIESGRADPMLMLLKEIGELRLAIEVDRGGVSLPMPEQVVDCGPNTWTLEFRAPLPTEAWNAQLSLLTGFAAARIMLDGGVGILRTLPPANEHAVRVLRRTARGLGVDWPAGESYPDFIRSLDPAVPEDLAMVVASTTLLRGAGYAGFVGSAPDQPLHAALASPYAHVTAPLRRLVDRFGLEICAAHCAGTPVPAWVLEALDELPDLMRDSGRRAGAYQGAILNLVEAATLQDRVGEQFAGVVVEADPEDGRRGEVVVRDPAVTAKVRSEHPLPVGEDVTLTLVRAEMETRRVGFTLP